MLVPLKIYIHALKQHFLNVTAALLLMKNDVCKGNSGEEADNSLLLNNKIKNKKQKKIKELHIP